MLSSSLVVLLLPLAAVQAAWDCSLSSEETIGRDLTVRHVVHAESQWMTMELIYEGQAWLGIGRNRDNEMVGGEAIIGLPNEENGPTNPGKYWMTTEDEDGSGVTLMADEKQTLMGASIMQNDTHTVLTFTKFLYEDNEYDIPADEASTWVWAVGRDNYYPAEHEQHGGFDLFLQPCIEVADPPPGNTGGTTDGDTGGTTEGDTGGTTDGEKDEPEETNGDTEEDDNDKEGSTNSVENNRSGITQLASADEATHTKWVAHGVFMALAWGVFVPLAIGASILRNGLTKLGFPKGFWYQIHRAFNVIAVLCTIIGFALAVSAFSEEGEEHFKENTHTKVGLAIFVMVLIQTLFGFIKPPMTPPPPTKDVSSSEEGAEETVEDGSDSDGSNSEPQKPLARRLWEYKHRCMGVALVGMAWYNCHSGIEEQVEKYGDQEDLTGAFWGVTAGIAGTIFVLAYVVRV